MKRNVMTTIAAIAVLAVSGAQARSYASTLFSDNFANDSVVNTSLWYWNSPTTPRINNQRLLLESTTNHGCEVISYSTFQYDTIEIKTPSYAWQEDTSIGFETWSPGHEGIVVTHGCFGCINDTITTPNTYLEWYINIPNWSSLASGDNVYKIVWKAPSNPSDPSSYATAILYINGNFSCQYTGPQVPRVPCTVRMNSSNDWNDNLQVAYVTVSTN